MNLTIKSPLQFSATQKAKQPDINNPQNKADFTALLKVAKPCAQYLGDFQSASIIVEENNLLVVSPAMSSQPIGGGATDYLFNQDGSVSRRQHGPVVAPQYRKPPTVTNILPAGSIDAQLLVKRQQEVLDRQTELSRG